jgi:hypothetical protein
MKKVLSSLTVLFTATLLLYSCNPIEEDELPPSNTSQMTVEEAYQLLQGSWYSYKRETVFGPVCAGGLNEIHPVNTFDLQYAGYKIEFTNNANVGPGLDVFNVPTYDLYYGGGNGTTYYSVVSGDNPTFSSWVTNIYYQVGSSDLFLSFGTMFLEGFAYDGGGKIVSLTENELVIQTVLGSPAPTLVYFKRSNETATPYNVPGLSGDYILDNYKEVNSGVVDVNEAIANGPQYSFNNEIYNTYNKLITYRGVVSGGNSSNYYLYLESAEPNGFTYEVSSTHLCSGNIFAYKIIQFNANELILRDGYLCNSYKDYHLTKVN